MMDILRASEGSEETETNNKQTIQKLKEFRL